MTLVMVVDDDQDLAEMLGIVLTSSGFDVDLVSRGDEALEVFRNNPPDLVLLDVKTHKTGNKVQKLKNKKTGNIKQEKYKKRKN